MTDTVDPAAPWMPEPIINKDVLGMWRRSLESAQDCYQTAASVWADDAMKRDQCLHLGHGYIEQTAWHPAQNDDALKQLCGVAKTMALLPSGYKASDATAVHDQLTGHIGTIKQAYEGLTS